MPENNNHFKAIMECKDCENLEDLIFDQTKIWFYVPTDDSFSKLASLCGRRNLEVDSHGEHCLSVKLSHDECHSFAVALYGAMSQHELKHVRVMTTQGEDPKPIDFGRVVNVDVFVNRIKGSWIIETIRNRKIESWFQPIVKLNDPDEIFGMEALLRVRDQDNLIIPPDYIFRVAEDANVLFSVDLIARSNAVETAAKFGKTGKIFINFNPSSVYDPAYCLRTTAAVIDKIGLKPSNIVFEITETERITDIDHLRGILAFYRRARFMCALDDIGSGWSSLNFLHTFNPDFVKLDMELIRGIGQDPFKQSIVKHLVQISKEQQIKVIEEGIETQREADFVNKIGADFGQGYFFAKPAPLDISEGNLLLAE